MTPDTKLVIVLVMTVCCCACTMEPGETGLRTNKVADQHLVSYSPIRRLTYRDACGSEGPLTLCVNRIMISDHATVVEATVKNSSTETYALPGQTAGGAVLADNAGATLVQEKGASEDLKGLEEKIVHFRLEGSFSGDPTVLVANTLRRKSHGNRDGGVSIMVNLGG